MQDFSGLWVPLVTPFHEEQIDHAALRRLVLHLGAAGVDGFVACGSTGEAAALTEDEQLEVLDTVLDASAGRPVLMGLSGTEPRSLAGRLRRAAERRSAGRQAAGFLVPPPPYVRPSQQGIVGHYLHLAEASPVPIVVYDIPYRTGSEITLQTLRTLAAHPRIRAVKDCGGNMHKTGQLIADGQLQVLAGEDAGAFLTLCLGGHGAIAASAHLHAQHFVALLEAVRTQQLVRARQIHHALAPLVHALFDEPNPGPLKAVLAHLGWCRDEMRAPMTPPGDGARARAVAAYAASASGQPAETGLSPR
jgi:4-hydroxy-tetrahydrodipicolinate synthase